MSVTARKVMSSPAFRSAVASHAPSASAMRHPSRHFMAVASSQSLLPLNSKPNQLTTRLYSLDQPNSSPMFSFMSPGGGGGGGGGHDGLEISRWPITKPNTILNIVPQGKRMVVERFGKLHAIHESGYFIAIPVVDRIAYVIDVRERAVDILPQSAITRDNVSVEVSGNLFVRVVDPERAAYGARNPLYAVMMVSTIIQSTCDIRYMTGCQWGWLDIGSSY